MNRASVIVPARKGETGLKRALESLAAAAKGIEVETIVIEDVDGRGASWARNRGLERATGEYVFFCDADDTVREGFFRLPLARLEETGADMCFFSASGVPWRRAYDLTGSEEVRSALLPAFFGLSFEDVARWNAGGDLFARRELGSVWRIALRRSVLERSGVRFDERMKIYEDAAFLSELVLHLRRVVSLDMSLYDYSRNPKGTSATVTGTRLHWDYKFELLAFRKRLAELEPAVWRYCEASVALSAVEMLRLRKTAGLGFGEFWRGLRDYVGDPLVRAALEAMPLSWRHPLVATAVRLLRLYQRIGAHPWPVR